MDCCTIHSPLFPLVTLQLAPVFRHLCMSSRYQEIPRDVLFPKRCVCFGTYRQCGSPRARSHFLSWKVSESGKPQEAFVAGGVIVGQVGSESLLPGAGDGRRVGGGGSQGPNVASHRADLLGPLGGLWVSGMALFFCGRYSIEMGMDDRFCTESSSRTL